jgi:hypothetical protein
MSELKDRLSDDKIIQVFLDCPGKQTVDIVALRILCQTQIDKLIAAGWRSPEDHSALIMQSNRDWTEAMQEKVEQARGEERKRIGEEIEKAMSQPNDLKCIVSLISLKAALKSGQMPKGG